VQHADAQEVKINLEQKNKLLRLTIKDNGKGFIQNKNNNGSNNEDILRGMGLKNISRRAELINGDIKITSKYGFGTTVILSVRIP
jgi:signal transduction histidine kinase